MPQWHFVEEPAPSSASPLLGRFTVRLFLALILLILAVWAFDVGEIKMLAQKKGPSTWYKSKPFWQSDEEVRERLNAAQSKRAKLIRSLAPKKPSPMTGADIFDMDREAGLLDETPAPRASMRRPSAGKRLRGRREERAGGRGLLWVDESGTNSLGTPGRGA